MLNLWALNRQISKHEKEMDDKSERHNISSWFDIIEWGDIAEKQFDALLKRQRAKVSLMLTFTLSAFIIILTTIAFGLLPIHTLIIPAMMLYPASIVIKQDKEAHRDTDDKKKEYRREKYQTYFAGKYSNDRLEVPLAGHVPLESNNPYVVAFWDELKNEDVIINDYPRETKKAGEVIEVLKSKGITKINLL